MQGLPISASLCDCFFLARPRIPGELSSEAPGTPDPPLRLGLAMVENVDVTQFSAPPPAGGLRPGARERG